MKCTRCGTNTDREATDRGICFDCYCELDLIAYNEHLKLNPARKYLEDFEAVPSAAGLANKRHCSRGEEE